MPIYIVYDHTEETPEIIGIYTDTDKLMKGLEQRWKHTINYYDRFEDYVHYNDFEVVRYRTDSDMCWEEDFEEICKEYFGNDDDEW